MANFIKGIQGAYSVSHLMDMPKEYEKAVRFCSQSKLSLLRVRFVVQHIGG
jgi:hypothetical protein